MEKLRFHFKLLVLFPLFLVSACGLSYSEVALRKAGAVDRAGNIIDLSGYNRTNENQKLYIINSRRYLAYRRGNGFVSATNRKSVDLIRKGRLAEANIYLSQIMDSAEKYPEIYNNSAVILEINGDRDEAVRLYFKACAAEPADEKYRYNFRMAGR